MAAFDYDTQFDAAALSILTRVLSWRPLRCGESVFLCLSVKYRKSTASRTRACANALECVLRISGLFLLYLVA